MYNIGFKIIYIYFKKIENIALYKGHKTTDTNNVSLNTDTFVIFSISLIFSTYTRTGIVSL